MRVLSLFSGIGGMDLGLERAGFTIAYQAEVDPYCCKVLAKHWPNVPNLGDVTKIDWSTLTDVEVIVGGYPCQPFSNAGKRQGEKDPRHLWPYFWDAIRTIRPKYALMENVRGHLTLGFGTVLRDLAAIGYDARWDCIPAAAVGAPHLRDRVFIIARPSRTKQPRDLANSNDAGSRDTLFTGWDAPWHGSAFMANSTSGQSKHERKDNGQALESEHSLRDAGCFDGRLDQPSEWSVDAYPNSQSQPNVTVDDGTQPMVADTQSPGCKRDGLSSRPQPQESFVTSRNSHTSGYDLAENWKVEPDVGRVAHGIPNRVDRLRGLGNAVVPQVAEYIGRLILANE